MSAEFLAQIGHIALVVAGFGFLIFIHEFGHFIVAKWKGVKVLKFSLGFGPALIRFQGGETEYALSIIPLGGFCKMAGEGLGQEEEIKDVPKDRLYTSKKVGQRAQIIVAGALMNLIAAIPLGILMVSLGAPKPIPKVESGTASAFEAGVHSGDLVTKVDGKPVKYWDEMQEAIESEPVNKPFSLTVKRDDTEHTYQVQRRNEDDDTLGMTQYITTQIGMVHPAEPARRAGLQLEDKILAIGVFDKTPYAKEDDQKTSLKLEPGIHQDGPNGAYEVKKAIDPDTGKWDGSYEVATDLKNNPDQWEKISPNMIDITDWSQFEQIARNSPGQELIMVVERAMGDGKTEKLTLQVTPRENRIYRTGAVIGSGLKAPVIAAVQGDSPASSAGLQEGDKILTIDGKKIDNWNGIFSSIANAGLSIPISVERNGQTVDVTVQRSKAGQHIGIASDNSLDPKIMIEEVEKGSPAAAAGLQPGDVIKKIDGQEVPQLSPSLSFQDDNVHSITVERNGEPHTVQLRPTEPTITGIVGVGPMVANAFYRPPTVLAAISDGVQGAVDMFLRTLEMLGKLLSGSESTKSLAGPVGILSMSYMQAETGMFFFIRFVLMLTISLGIFNLLPIPVLDGGHLLFLGIEKIKGRPVNERTMETAQYVGLALLLGLMLFATTNDFTNFIFGRS